jgi:hypothetical protein
MTGLQKAFWIAVALALGTALVAAGEAACRMVWPTPPGIDARDMVRMGAHVARLPKAVFAALIAANGVGTFVASYLAGKKVGGRFALIPGEVLGLFGLMNVLLVPHPSWFIIGLLVTFTLTTLVGAWLGARNAERATG